LWRPLLPLAHKERPQSAQFPFERVKAIAQEAQLRQRVTDKSTDQCSQHRSGPAVERQAENRSNDRQRDVQCPYPARLAAIIVKRDRVR
jgi:hypothetical protein